MKDEKILYILESYASKSDVYGNRYWWHRVTSTETGRSIKFEACSDGNARSCVGKGTGSFYYPGLYSSTTTDVPIREHNRQMKDVKLSENNQEELSLALSSLTD